MTYIARIYKFTYPFYFIVFPVQSMELTKYSLRVCVLVDK